jgi:hypothetical protein
VIAFQVGFYQLSGAYTTSCVYEAHKNYRYLRHEQVKIKYGQPKVEVVDVACVLIE